MEFEDQVGKLRSLLANGVICGIASTQNIMNKKIEENKTLTDKIKQLEKELLRTSVILDATRKTEVHITSKAHALDNLLIF